MSITPRGMSIQEAYRLFRDEKLEVNRMYQRKLVWTTDEKESLIDSILKKFPIPLILLAEEKGSNKYEIIDGMQRLNAIFTFIENAFTFNDKFFDVREFSRAKQAGAAGQFSVITDENSLLSPALCADLLDYQLAVTIYPAEDEEQVTQVFGRINSGGKTTKFSRKTTSGNDRFIFKLN